MKKYDLDEDFFETIDTERKAYWLGFLYADGYIRSNKLNFLRLKLSIKDISHMEKFRNDIGSTHRLEIYEDCKNPYCQITIGSKKMVCDLISKGCVTNKGFKIRMPDIDHSLIPHFIRGYFDGDGGITHRGANSYRVSIISNVRFIEDIFSYLGYGNINIHHKNRDLANLNIDKYSYRFREYIYSESTIYLDRKSEIFNMMDNPHINNVWCPYNYLITNLESGETFSVKNLSRFCKDNGLSKSGMYKVASKKYKSHNGFTCEKIELD